jgi:hypothetical protein
VPPESVSRHAKIVRDAMARDGEAVSLLRLSDRVCVHFGVRFLGEVGTTTR